MTEVISGVELFNWYQDARRRALFLAISPLEIDLFLQFYTNLSNLDLKLKNYQNYHTIELLISFEELKAKWDLRIEKRVPIQYLIGSCFWRDLTLKVSPDVLIPRPETELIIDIVLDLISENPSLRAGNWLDLGTGSGALALSLAKHLVNSNIFAVDKSRGALSIAQENSHLLNITKNIYFRLGNWFEPITDLQGKVSGIVTNPPYIPSEIIGELQPEVANHEPRRALDGGEDGLRDIRHLITTAPSYLIPNGILIIEIMAGQAPMVMDLFKQENQYDDVTTYHDLSGEGRFVMGKKSKSIIS
ncbi:MAG: peptide chain release factor N(5)-glutamine methyltransferase [Cyanobacterium sp. T60_A2020_053]|nr:peptide chain release factor N(5)-glutamine methyltransferase [Cyanobacterium sp. T60_A2020_053]